MPKRTIRILFGGSPCQKWSIAQSNNRETTNSGIGWELFKNYLIAKDKFKPHFFLYENVKSMSNQIRDAIDAAFGVGENNVERTLINSALVSAQNRQRYYWHNFGFVEQPEDRGIILRDILESGESLTAEKSYSLTTSCKNAIPEDNILKHRHTMVAEPVRIGTVENSAKEQKHDSKQYRVYPPDGKATTLCGEGGGLVAKTGIYTTPVKAGSLPNMDGSITNAQGKRYYVVNGKSVTLQANSKSGGSSDLSGLHTGLYAIPTNGGKEKPIYRVENGSIEIKGKLYPTKLPDGYYIIRKLTCLEAERLQTLPDFYTAAPGISSTQRYRGLGNGWTAEVIIHLLQKGLNGVSKNARLEVLSVYDGIGTARYCLDKMGFKNVTYKAYETDKFARKVATFNYPDIEEKGDAFLVRENNWCYYE